MAVYILLSEHTANWLNWFISKWNEHSFFDWDPTAPYDQRIGNWTLIRAPSQREVALLQPSIPSDEEGGHPPRSTWMAGCRMLHAKTGKAQGKLWADYELVSLVTN